MTTPLEALLDHVTQEGRVCPQPAQWNKLWALLRDHGSPGSAPKPSPPLILAAWHVASDADKRHRLRTHIQWAADHGVLLEVDVFLRALPESEWHHDRQP